MDELVRNKIYSNIFNSCINSNNTELLIKHININNFSYGINYDKYIKIKNNSNYSKIYESIKDKIIFIDNISHDNNNNNIRSNKNEIYVNISTLSIKNYSIYIEYITNFNITDKDILCIFENTSDDDIIKHIFENYNHIINKDIINVIPFKIYKYKNIETFKLFESYFNCTTLFSMLSEFADIGWLTYEYVKYVFNLISRLFR